MLFLSRLLAAAPLAVAIFTSGHAAPAQPAQSAACCCPDCPCPACTGCCGGCTPAPACDTEPSCTK